MDTTEALAVVADYRERYRLAGTLEALQDMKLRSSNGDLSERNQEAFEVAFDGFRRLFYGSN